MEIVTKIKSNYNHIINYKTLRLTLLIALDLEAHEYLEDDSHKLWYDFYKLSTHILLTLVSNHL